MRAVHEMGRCCFFEEADAQAARMRWCHVMPRWLARERGKLTKLRGRAVASCSQNFVCSCNFHEMSTLFNVTYIVCRAWHELEKRIHWASIGPVDLARQKVRVYLEANGDIVPTLHRSQSLFALCSIQQPQLIEYVLQKHRALLHVAVRTSLSDLDQQLDGLFQKSSRIPRSIMTVRKRNASFFM